MPLGVLRFSHCATRQKRYYVSRENEAGITRTIERPSAPTGCASGPGQTRSHYKGDGMSREDDFDDVMDSPDEVDAGQDDTSEPLLEEESIDESADEDADEAAVVTVTETEEDEGEEPAQPSRPARKPP